MSLKQHVGFRVKAARQQRGLTQEQLAERVEKTAESISNIERGQVAPPLETLYRIATELETSLTFFVEGVENSRQVARNRLELEERLRSLGEALTDEEMRLTVSVVEAIKSHGIR